MWPICRNTWCFINKVREEHDQIINRFGTGATRLANHPNEHNAYIYIYRYSLPTSVQWQFSGIPPPPQLLTSNLFHPSSGTGEFSGFGPCSGLGALPQDSKPKYAYYCYQIKCKGELVKHIKNITGNDIIDRHLQTRDCVSRSIRL